MRPRCNPPDMRRRRRRSLCGVTVLAAALLLVIIPCPCQGFLNLPTNDAVDRLPRSRVILHANLQGSGEKKTKQSSAPTGANKKMSTRKQSSPTARSVAALALMDGPDENFPSRKLDMDMDYRNHLDSRDQALARQLLATTERRKGQIDKVLRHFYPPKNRFRKSRPQDMLVQAVCRLGAAQLLFLNDTLPSYAVLQETVQILRQIPDIHVPNARINFVNAVLRNVDREGHQILEQKTELLDNIEPWLGRRWVDAYGKVKTAKILDSVMERSSSICITTKEQISAENVGNHPVVQAFQEWLETSQDGSLTVLPNGSIRISGVSSPVSTWPLYEDGSWWIQDPSASIPAMALYHSLMDDSNSKILDLCSAPGGKTMQLASYPKIEHLTAVEVSEARTKQLHTNLQRTQQSHKCTVVVADGSTFIPSDGNLFDGILIDAPCSATGLGRRRPDVLRRSEESISELIDIQRKLLQHAVDNLLKPGGGILVYATCSLLPEESEDQMRWLLKQYKGIVENVPIRNGEIGGFDNAIDDANGWVRVIPGVLEEPMTSCDGFFVARIRKL